MEVDFGEWMPHDSDIKVLHQVKETCDRWAEDHGWRVDLEDYRKQVMERYNDAGYIANILVYEKLLTNGEREYEFLLQIDGPIEGKEFDYDQQVHEQVNDLLDLGEKGFIPSIQKADMDQEALDHNKKPHTHDGQGWHYH